MALQMLDVGALAAEKVIQADYFMPVVQQPLAQMRSQKPCAASHQCSHASSSVEQDSKGSATGAEAAPREAPGARYPQPRVPRVRRVAELLVAKGSRLACA